MIDLKTIKLALGKHDQLEVTLLMTEEVPDSRVSMDPFEPNDAQESEILDWDILSGDTLSPDGEVTQLPDRILQDWLPVLAPEINRILEK